MTKITENELVEALRLAAGETRDAEGFATIDEIATAAHLCTRTVRDRLREVFRAGNLESRRVYRTAIDGRRSPVPAYRFKNRKFTKGH